MGCNLYTAFVGDMEPKFAEMAEFNNIFNNRCSHIFAYKP